MLVLHEDDARAAGPEDHASALLWGRRVHSARTVGQGRAGLVPEGARSGQAGRAGHPAGTSGAREAAGRCVHQERGGEPPDALQQLPSGRCSALMAILEL